MGPVAFGITRVNDVSVHQSPALSRGTLQSKCCEATRPSVYYVCVSDTAKRNHSIVQWWSPLEGERAASQHVGIVTIGANAVT